MLSLILIITTYIQLSASVCIPANVCTASKYTYSGTSYGSSTQYICQDDGTKCLASYNNLDCSGDPSYCDVDTTSDDYDFDRWYILSIEYD